MSEDSFTHGSAWDICSLSIQAHSKKTHDSWRDELDKFLILAALFSAVVTSFAIESSKSVRPDTNQTMVALLQTIVLQLDNITNPRTDATSINLTASLPQISYITRRSYLLYSLSLALSLISVLGGILGLQWLREYSRRRQDVSHQEYLIRQHDRHEAFKNWHAFTILKTLPVLLLVSVIFFFVGLLGTLWETDSTTATIVSGVVAIALFFRIITVLPTLHLLWIYSRPESKQLQCPYC